MIVHKNTMRKYNLPEQVKFCTKCTISNQRPRITFNSNGLCSACQFTEVKNRVDWKGREDKIRRLCDRFRRKDGYYDVIVPASGGKDSGIVAHKMKYKYGMNPLTVTWSPHLYTDMGWKNIQSFIHKGGFHNILGTPNPIVHRKLTRLSFDILGDPFQPFIYGQTNFPLQIAVRFGIPLIMYGENGEVEYGGDMKNAESPTRDYEHDHARHYFSDMPPETMVEHGVKHEEIVPYMTPSIEELKLNKTEIHFFSYYEKWIPQENYYYCSEHTGFQANSVRNEGTYSKYASFDDKLDGFHYYLGFIKFGIGRATSDTAHEIRDGHLTREEGVALVKKYDGEFPKKYFNEFLEYCEMDESHFYDVVDSWRSPHLWDKKDGKWMLKHQVSL